MKNLRAIMRDPVKNQIMENHYTRISIMVILSQNGHLKIVIIMPINKRKLLFNFMDLFMLERTVFLLNYKNMDDG